LFRPTSYQLGSEGVEVATTLARSASDGVQRPTCRGAFARQDACPTWES